MQDFWASPMGIIRQQFEAQQGVRVKPGGRVRVPIVVDTAPVVPHQLQRDIEQLEYLLERDSLSAPVRDHVTDVVLVEYKRALEVATEALAKLEEKSGDEVRAFTLRYEKAYKALFCLYKKALHLHSGDFVPSDALAPRDFGALEEDFLRRSHRAIVIDDFLGQAALYQLRDFLLESTFWFDAKKGYVGTYLHTAFASPIVAQIDWELRAKLPRVLEGLELQNAWSFMYDGSMGGVNTHADDAQVQINIFLTPTEANMWSEDSNLPGGGLIIYGCGPPEEWGFLDYNNDMRGDQEKERIEEVIASTGHWNVTVPYLQNRAIMFDSTYFHRTDDMCFKKGYKNRRINVTFLYGKRANLIYAPTMKA